MADVPPPRPSPSALLTAWTAQPVAIAIVLGLGLAYALGVRRLRASGRPWPPGRSVTFAVGLLLLLWLGTGFPQVYDRSLYWVWTARTLALWLAVPLLLLFGAPIQLATALRRDGHLQRVLRSRVVRVLANPLVSPALVPILSFALFFGPVAGWAIASPAAGWLLDVLLLVIGALMVLPLVGLEDGASSLAVGLSLLVGSFELVIDALPGIVLRLSTRLTTGWFDHRQTTGWAPSPLHDQQLAGAIVWCVAELIDLPFLALVYRRWLRADARDAARVDAVLEAERAARGALRPAPPDGAGATGPPSGAETPSDWDAPWWLSDPAMQQRLRRPR